MAQFQKFSNGITASVVLLGKHRQLLEIGDNSVLAIPEGVTPNAFCLVLHAEEKTRVVFAQKDVGQDNGGYNSSFSEVEILQRQVFSPPIQVVRPKDGKAWTAWHQEKPNRMDCWFLEKNGRCGLFQVGVITPNNGETFCLIGEWRWYGRLFRQPGGKLVGKPENPVWGPMSPKGTRDGIFQHPDMQKLVSQTEIDTWNGSPEELDPPLSPVPEGNFARVEWYIPFAGQNGQGIVRLHDGTNAWVHGEEILDPPDADGIKRLRRNNLIQYQEILQQWGSKKDGPPKLVRIKRIPETNHTPTKP